MKKPHCHADVCKLRLEDHGKCPSSEYVPLAHVPVGHTFILYGVRFRKGEETTDADGQRAFYVYYLDDDCTRSPSRWKRGTRGIVNRETPVLYMGEKWEP